MYACGTANKIDRALRSFVQIPFPLGLEDFTTSKLKAGLQQLSDALHLLQLKARAGAAVRVDEVLRKYVDKFRQTYEQWLYKLKELPVRARLQLLKDGSYARFCGRQDGGKTRKTLQN